MEEEKQLLPEVAMMDPIGNVVSIESMIACETLYQERLGMYEIRMVQSEDVLKYCTEVFLHTRMDWNDEMESPNWRKPPMGNMFEDRVMQERVRTNNFDDALAQYHEWFRDYLVAERDCHFDPDHASKIALV